MPVGARLTIFQSSHSRLVRVLLATIRAPADRAANTSSAAVGTDGSLWVLSRTPPAEAFANLVMRNDLRQGRVGQDVRTRRPYRFRPIAVVAHRARINPASSGQPDCQGQRGQRCEFHGASPWQSAWPGCGHRPSGSPDRPRLGGDRGGSGPRSQNRLRRPERPRAQRADQAPRAPL